jgi:hypothetical protein
MKSMSARFIDPDTKLEQLLLAAPEWGPVLEPWRRPVEVAAGTSGAGT